MSSTTRLYATVAENLNVFRNWVERNDGFYIQPDMRIIALVHQNRYIFVAANVEAQIQGRRFAGVEFLDDSATPFFREAVLNRVVPTE
jgi:hypothetical protein